MENIKTNNPTAMLRIGLGVILLAHGLLKLLVFTLPGTAQFFGSVGFPEWAAYPVTIFEIGGGLMLIAGLYARWVAWLSVPIMLGATFVHFGNGWVFSNPNGGWEFPAFLVLVAVVVALDAGNRWSRQRAYEEDLTC